jgi:hypothetical protein
VKTPEAPSKFLTKCSGILVVLSARGNSPLPSFSSARCALLWQCPPVEHPSCAYMHPARSSSTRASTASPATRPSTSPALPWTPIYGNASTPFLHTVVGASPSTLSPPPTMHLRLVSSPGTPNPLPKLKTLSLFRTGPSRSALTAVHTIEKCYMLTSPTDSSTASSPRRPLSACHRGGAPCCERTIPEQTATFLCHSEQRGLHTVQASAVSATELRRQPRPRDLRCRLHLGPTTRSQPANHSAVLP